MSGYRPLRKRIHIQQMAHATPSNVTDVLKTAVAILSHCNGNQGHGTWGSKCPLARRRRRFSGAAGYLRHPDSGGRTAAGWRSGKILEAAPERLFTN